MISIDVTQFPHDRWLFESSGHAVNCNGMGHDVLCGIVSYINTLLVTTLIEAGYEPTVLSIEDGHFLLDISIPIRECQTWNFYILGMSWLSKAFSESIQFTLYHVLENGKTMVEEEWCTFEKSDEALSKAYMSKH